MKRLGYKLTWPTVCFLGCSEEVWAHTNGDGDFVLFDALGPPWHVHPCYEPIRHGKAYEVELSQLQQILAELDEMPTRVSFTRPAHVIVVDPSEYLGRPFVKKGLVEFYRERKLEHLIKGASPSEQHQTNRILGNRKSELAIVDRNGNLFSVFADLSDTVISAGAIVEAEIAACRVSVKKLGCVFLCHSLKIIPQQRTRESRINLALNDLQL